MKQLHTGLIVFDKIDIICISFSIGSGLAYLVQKRKEKVTVDPIITELKEKSPIIAVSLEGKPLKLPLVRGGVDKVDILLSRKIKNRRLAALIQAIIYAKKTQKQLKLLQIISAILNSSLIFNFGLSFAVGGSVDYTHFILISFPATVGGFVIGQMIANPLASVFLPLAILFGRGIEDISNPYEKCMLFCKAAEEFHNKQLAIEMKEVISSFAKGKSITPPLQRLICVEDKLSLLQRYKLRELVKSIRARKHIQYFSQFIKKFPECDVDPETVYKEIVGKITE